MMARVCCGVQRYATTLSQRWRPLHRLAALHAAEERTNRRPRYFTRTVAAVGSQRDELISRDAPAKVEVPEICPGCGISLQQTHPDKPGYVRIPKAKQSKEMRFLEPGPPSQFDQTQEFLTSAEITETNDESANLDKQETPVTENVPELKEEEAPVLVCERCFSLRNYGKLKNVTAEQFVPKFNLERVLKPRIAKNRGRKVVLVCVVDIFDFDGSLPVNELKSLFPSTSKLPEFLEFIVVGNKVDLVLNNIAPPSLEVWLRTRLKEHQLPPATRVHLISSHTMLGVRDLMVGLRKELVWHADCYIIGTQNAGKSSMLNALRRVVDKNTRSQVTTASLPGTTLGFVDVPGLPVAKTCRIYDTPGLENRSQITNHLTAEEMRLVQPRRELKPRTYRFGPGNSILIGGVVRVDLESCEGRSLYVTIWVSDELRCYLGKTENVEKKLQQHRGNTLTPPISPSEADQGLWPEIVEVTGDSWKSSSVDIVIAGLGWVAVGCKGEAKFTVWTLPGVRLTTRPALLPTFANVFQKPGFSDSVKARGIRGK